MHYTQKKLIRDRLVCGVHSDTLRKSLLRDPKLTLAKAMSVCQIYEQTEQHTRDPATPQTTTTTTTKVQKLQIKIQTRCKASPTMKNCNNCGSDHPAKRDKCPAYGQQCNGCKKWNHFKKCCRSTQTNQPKWRYTKTIHNVEPHQTNSDEGESFFIDGVTAENVDSIANLTEWIVQHCTWYSGRTESGHRSQV